MASLALPHLANVGRNVGVKQLSRIPDFHRPAPARLSVADSRALFILLGEVVFSNETVAARRQRVLQGLCDLVGGDGFATASGPEEISSLAGRCGVSISTRTAAGISFLGGTGGNFLVWCKTAAVGESSVICLFRNAGQPPFSEREERLARIVAEEVSWLHDTGEPPPVSDAAGCSTRERQILRLLRLGLDRKAIATSLCISPETVATWQKAIYRGHGVGTQVELMRVFPRFSSHENPNVP